MTTPPVPTPSDLVGGYPALRVGVVDVYLVHVVDGAWHVLVLQRAATGTRCPLAWEAVHGRIEPGERPEQAARREVAEETALPIARLYNVTTQAFYLHGVGAVQVAVAFCAFVDAPRPPTLGGEHGAWAWLPYDEALARLAWPREREALAHCRSLFATGDAGPLEDVLRVM
ncbi:MAG TPA: NUDIX domain-containing protein [Gemmatirosa sp.]|nr:NUDIX domain-containing protein [Gemmatirosa sp.]